MMERFRLKTAPEPRMVAIGQSAGARNGDGDGDDAHLLRCIYAKEEADRKKRAGREQSRKQLSRPAKPRGADRGVGGQVLRKALGGTPGLKRDVQRP
jgi:hypothetical protein